MGKTILVADDDKDVVDVIKQHLESLGYNVLVAMEGNEALRKAKLYKPDIIILDILMPGMDGVTIMTNLRLEHETRSIDVIFLTGFISKDRQEQFRNEIKNAFFLAKPFDLKEITDIVEQALQNKKN